MKTKKILISILLLTLCINNTYADDQLDVKNNVNYMRNATQSSGLLGDILTKIFDTNGKIKESFLSIVDTAINGYIPMWSAGKLINSPLYYLSGKIGIGTTSPSEVLTLSGGLSITKSPDSGDDVGSRDYNDARYLGLFGTSPDSNLLDGLDSTAFQKDIGALSCANGIASVADNGTVTCASAPTESDPEVGTITSTYLPKWNGTSLVTSEISENGATTFVGIGTGNPGAKLEVNGNIIASTPTANSHLATKAYVDATVAASGGGLKVYQYDGTTLLGNFLGVTVSSNITFLNYQTSSGVLKSAGGGVMLLDGTNYQTVYHSNSSCTSVVGYASGLSGFPTDSYYYLNDGTYNNYRIGNTLHYTYYSGYSSVVYTKVGNGACSASATNNSIYLRQNNGSIATTCGAGPCLVK